MDRGLRDEDGTLMCLLQILHFKAQWFQQFFSTNSLSTLWPQLDYVVLFCSSGKRVRFWGNWASTVTPRLTLLSLLGLLLDLLQLLHQLFLLPFNLLLLFLCQLTLLLLIFQKGTRKENEGCLQDSKVHGASRSSAI